MFCKQLTYSSNGHTPEGGNGQSTGLYQMQVLVYVPTIK